MELNGRHIVPISLPTALPPIRSNYNYISIVDGINNGNRDPGAPLAGDL
jgi:hypothetical protein